MDYGRYVAQSGRAVENIRLRRDLESGQESGLVIPVVQFR